MQGGGDIGIHGEEVVEGRQLEGTLMERIILSSMLASAGTGHRSPGGEEAGNYSQESPAAPPNSQTNQS